MNEEKKTVFLVIEHEHCDCGKADCGGFAESRLYMTTREAKTAAELMAPHVAAVVPWGDVATMVGRYVAQGWASERYDGFNACGRKFDTAQAQARLRKI